MLTMVDSNGSTGGVGPTGPLLYNGTGGVAPMLYNVTSAYSWLSLTA